MAKKGKTKKFNEEASQDSPKIGQTMPDGATLGPVSPVTGRPMLVDSKTYSYFDWNEEEIKAKRAKGYRVPTVAELSVLFNNRTAIGGYETKNGYRSWYESSERCEDGKGTHTVLLNFQQGHTMCQVGEGSQYLPRTRLVC